MTRIRTHGARGSLPNKQWCTIRNESSSSADLYIYDVIGGGFFFFDDESSAQGVADRIRNLTVSELRVHINSPGGDAYDGVAIYNALKAHDARVTVYVDGLAASAASVIAMAGDEIVMGTGSQMMIHEAWMVTRGDADELRADADRLDKMGESIASVYAERAGGTEEFWRDAMRVESWYTAQEAVLAGLADRVSVKEAANQNHMPGSIAASFDLAHCRYRGREEAPAPVINTVSSAGAAGADRKEGTTVSTLNEAICQRLGIPADADEATITAALDEALNERAGDGEDTEPDPEADGAAGDDTDEPVEDDEPTSDNDADDTDDETGDTDGEDSLTVAVDRDTFRELQEAARYGMAARKREAAAARAAKVDQAIAENRITRAARDRWLASMEADEEDTTARLNRIPKDTIPRNEIGYAAPNQDDGQTRADLDRKADRMGLIRPLDL